MKRGSVHSCLERLARRLEVEKVQYAIVGGMALNMHGYARMTQDVDVLMTAAGLEDFVMRCVGRGYVPSFPGAMRAFRDTETQVTIEVLVTGEYPGDGKPKPVAFPDPAAASVDLGGYRVIRLTTLIELKLASGLSAPHRLRDLADVQDLIRVLELPLDLDSELDTSVGGEYRRLWHAAQPGRAPE